jgi:hypothetical protein
MTRLILRLLIFVVLYLTSLLTLAPAQVSVTTWQNDNWRTGQNVNETTLTTTSFGSNNNNSHPFGLLCRVVLSLHGPTKPSYQIYSQPLVVPNQGGGMTVYIATLGDVVYAITIPANWTGACTGVNGITTASRDVLDAYPGEYPVDCCYIGAGGCATIKPTVGILGTPVIDTTTNTLYLVAYSQFGPTNYNPAQCPPHNNPPSSWVYRLHALDLTSGSTFLQDKAAFHSPVPIPATMVGMYTTFSSQQELQRPGLLLLPGVTPQDPQVDIGFSMMDATYPNPSGWVYSYHAQDLTIGGYPRVFATTPGAVGSSTPRGGGIWQGGGGLASGKDANLTNYIYFSTADGVFSPNNLQQPTTQAGDSFVKLAPDLSTLSAYFAPSDALWRWCGTDSMGNPNDLDFGSGGVTLIPDGTLTTTNWTNLAVKVEKEGGLWAIDRTSPGGYTGGSCGCNSQCTNPNGNIQTVQTGGVFHNNPAYWNNRLYISGTNVSGAIFPLTVYPIANSGQCPEGGNTGPICHAIAQGTCLSGTTCRKFSFGATAAVSSNGTNINTAIVWTLEKQDDAIPDGAEPAILHAFRADNLNELYNSTTCLNRDQAGHASKYAVPTVANGLVFVGTQTELDIYGVFTQPPTCN